MTATQPVASIDLDAHDVERRVSHQTRMRDLWRPILKSASAGSVNRFGGLLIRILTIPLVIRYLGNERYGLWMTIASVTAYVTLLDFGIVSALVNRLTDCYQKGNLERANTYVVSSTVLVCVIAVVGALLGVIATRFIDFPAALKLSSAAAIAEARPTVVVVIVLASLQLATSAILRVPYTMQRGHLTEAYSALGNGVSLAGIVGAVVYRAGLPYLASALMIGPLVASAGVAAHLKREGTLALNWIGRRRCVAALRTLGSSASDFVVLQVGATLLSTLQFVLLAGYRGAEAVAPYAILSQALIALQIPFSVLQQPLWTRLAALYQKRDVSSIRQLFTQYLRIAGVYSLVAAVILIFLANPVLAIVLKKQLVLSLGLRVGFAICCAFGLIAGGNLGSLLLATDMSRQTAILTVAQVAAFLVCAALLTPTLGGLGMVLSVIVSYLVALPVLVRLVPARLTAMQRSQ